MPIFSNLPVDTRPIARDDLNRNGSIPYTSGTEQRPPHVRCGIVLDDRELSQPSALRGRSSTTALILALNLIRARFKLSQPTFPGASVKFWSSKLTLHPGTGAK